MKPSIRDDRALRRHLLWLLRSRDAHLGFDRAVAKLPMRLRAVRPAGLPYSAWELLEHMRITQWDILEFSRNPQHVSPEWPVGYWPSPHEPPEGDAWRRSVAAFHAGLKAFERLISNPATDLFTPIPHGEGQTMLREALLLSDHNAYHLGQLLVVRRLLGAWEE